MAEYTIDKIEYGGNTYKLQDNVSGYVTTDDSRLSDARTPLAHNQALSTITGADDLKAIEALTGTSGLLKKTAVNTWTLDTNTYLTSYTETDPTVPSWAKAETKPTYTASEVGALPSTTVIPSKTSDLTNDSGFITSYTDEKVKSEPNTTAATLYPVASNSASASTGTTLKHSAIQFYLGADSTTDGYAAIRLGNNLVSGTEGAKQGYIRLYSETTGYTDLVSDASIYRLVHLPNKAGTIALTSDLSEYVSMSSDVTDAYVYCSSIAKIGVGGLHSTDNIKYTFRAMATAPSLYDVTNSTEIWRGYTTLNKPTASDVGAVPTSRTINGHALTSNITLTGEDVGIGAYLSYTIQSTTVNTGASAYTPLKLGQSSQTAVTLSAGRYLIIASVQFPAASSGTYGVSVLRNGSTVTNSRQKYGFTDTVQRVQTVAYIELDGTDTFGVGAFQTGASSQALTGYAMWVRLREN